ncbi:MAG: hypothetical protein A3K90_05350 [Pelodictyon luteolum]|uniref:Uncharacterized protein n=1 Tax=Pelodictyon luteolum TaxID=1100 RepID=A0A165MED8_PELLU|nr:hypothetical protein [Pelodictyon luteolum]KZK75148.1 MAG: hypothetical protein A3K90_05350 [Pelodictyon luteolum]
MILNSMHASGWKYFQLPSKKRLLRILVFIGVAFLLYAHLRPAPDAVDTAPVASGADLFEGIDGGATIILHPFPDLRDGEGIKDRA